MTRGSGKIRARLALLVVASLGGIACEPLSVDEDGSPARALQTVRLATFPSYGKNSGYYLAQVRDYWREAGLKFELVPSFDSTLPLLESGEVDIAQDLCSEALTAIDQGAPIRIIGVRDAMLPVGTVSLQDSGIESPRDYEGKTWGDEVGSQETELLPALARLVGFDASTVTVVNLDFNARLPALLAHRVDIVSAYYGSGYATFLVAARHEGVPLQFIRWSDYGLDIYGQCFVARKDWLDSAPAAATAFLSVAARAFQEAARDPAAAVAATLRENPDEESEAETIQVAWDQAKTLLWDDYSRQYGLFAIDPAKLQRTLELAAPGATVLLSATYDTSYLPSQ